MPGIVEFPQVVQNALAQYGDLFANACQRRHFAEYLTGLMVAERKTVLGINREFAQTTDQSCLNRFLTDAEWDIGALNQRRLEQLQKDPSTRYSDQGVIPIDNTLIDRDGLVAVHRCSSNSCTEVCARTSTFANGRLLVFQATVPGSYPLRAA